MLAVTVFAGRQVSGADYSNLIPSEVSGHLSPDRSRPKIKPFRTPVPGIGSEIWLGFRVYGYGYGNYC